MRSTNSLSWPLYTKLHWDLLSTLYKDKQVLPLPYFPISTTTPFLTQTPQDQDLHLDIQENVTSDHEAGEESSVGLISPENGHIESIRRTSHVPPKTSKFPSNSNLKKHKIDSISELDDESFEDPESFEMLCKKQISVESFSDDDQFYTENVSLREVFKQRKKGSGSKLRKRITMSQNYKSTIIRGLIRVAQACRKKKSNIYYEEIVRIIKDMMIRIPQLAGLNFEVLFSILIDYMENIGKVKSKRRNQDKFNFSNGKIIKDTFYCDSEEKNDPIIRFKKEAAFMFLFFFLEDGVFSTWVDEECSSSEINKRFLKENVSEIRKVFKDPLNYKANFNDLE